MKHPLDEDWITLLNDLATLAGCDWYQDSEGNMIITHKQEVKAQ